MPGPVPARCGLVATSGVQSFRTHCYKAIWGSPNPRTTPGLKFTFGNTAACGLGHSGGRLLGHGMEARDLHQIGSVVETFVTNHCIDTLTLLISGFVEHP